MAEETERIRGCEAGGGGRQRRAHGRLLPHSGHHAGLQDGLQPLMAGRRNVERLHLCPPGDNAEHQRRHHIPGDPLHRAETEVFPRNKDSQGHPANQLGVDHGVHRHPCGRRADTRPGPVGRGENQDGKRPYRGDRPGASVVQNHDGVRPHRPLEETPDRGRAPPVVVERPARNRPRGGQPPHENLRRPRVAGKK